MPCAITAQAGHKRHNMLVQTLVSILPVTNRKRNVKISACLAVFCCRILLFFIFKILLFVNKGAAASGAGQQFEKQPKFKDHFIHKACWAVKSITTALAAVHGFFFHTYAPSANCVSI